MTGPQFHEPVYDSETDSPDWGLLGGDEQARAMSEYLADMIGQLEDMARRSRLDLLVYLLSMAKSEAEASARGDVALRQDA